MRVSLDGHTPYESTAKPSVQDELNSSTPLSKFEGVLKKIRTEGRSPNCP